MPHSRPSVWSRLPLARQLFLAMFTAVIVATSVYLVYDVRASHRRLDAMERTTMKAVFPVMQRVIEDAMIHKSRREIRDLFAVAAGTGVAEKMYLLDSRKHAVDLDDLAEGRAPRRYTPPEVPGRTHLIMDFPMVARPQCAACHGSSASVLGYVRLIPPHQEQARVLAENAESHLIVLPIMALALGAWALLVVKTLVARPLARIAEAMKSLRAGRFETRISPAPEGEFGAICAGFNSMVEALERDRREIVELHRRQVAHMERLASAGELAANLAHEIRNPLTGISSAIQVMQAETPVGNPRRDILGKILAQLTRMDQTMGSYLSFARLPQAEVRPYDLGEALQRVCFLIEPRGRAQHVEIRCAVEPGLPKLVGDAGQIEQVLLNLSINAIQAMPTGGSLTLSARRNGSEVRLEIADDGRGIPASQLDRIFQPFFTTRENGSGLGLPIARQIVLAHSGELWLESVPGRGTTAYIRLPVKEMEPACQPSY